MYLFQRIVLGLSLSSRFIPSARFTTEIEENSAQIDTSNDINYESEIKEKENPLELGINSSSYSCLYNNPCVKRYHKNRTYYGSYREIFFILCYKNDTCIELACPPNFIWNASLGHCEEQEEVQDYEYDKHDLDMLDSQIEDTKENMNKYDCLKKYPCISNQIFTPDAIYRHVDETKFILCSHYQCIVNECPQYMKWYQEFHKCLIPIDYEKLKHALEKSENKNLTESNLETNGVESGIEKNLSNNTKRDKVNTSELDKKLNIKPEKRNSRFSLNYILEKIFGNDFQ